jgi:hypothetical protein
MNMRSTFALAMMAVAAAGCGEKAQVAGQGPAAKAAAKPWAATQSTSLASGWKSGGDQAAWEAQMRTRAQGQNENSRIAAVPAAAPTKTP